MSQKCVTHCVTRYAKVRYTFKVLRYISANYVSHVHVSHCQQLIDSVINLYIQKEQLILLDDEGHPSLFAPIMIATLSTCSQLERDNISYRLQSVRKRSCDKRNVSTSIEILSRSNCAQVESVAIIIGAKRDGCPSSSNNISCSF